MKMAVQNFQVLILIRWDTDSPDFDDFSLYLPQIVAQMKENKIILVPNSTKIERIVCVTEKTGYLCSLTNSFILYITLFVVGECMVLAISFEMY